jgi:hypothetical protein
MAVQEILNTTTEYDDGVPAVREAPALSVTDRETDHQPDSHVEEGETIPTPTTALKGRESIRGLDHGINGPETPDPGPDEVVEAELVEQPPNAMGDETAEAQRLGFPNAVQYREVAGEARAAGYDNILDFARDLDIRSRGLAAIHQIDTYLHQLGNRPDLPGDHQAELARAYLAERQQLADAVVESDTKVRDGYIGSMKADGIAISPAMESILRQTNLDELRITVNEMRKAAGRGPAARPTQRRAGGSAANVTPIVSLGGRGSQNGQGQTASAFTQTPSPSIKGREPYGGAAEMAASTPAWKRNVGTSYEELFSKSGVYKG